MSERLEHDHLPDYGCNRDVIEAVEKLGADLFGEHFAGVQWGHRWNEYRERLESVALVGVRVAGRTVEELWHTGAGTFHEECVKRIGPGINSCMGIHLDLIEDDAP